MNKTSKELPITFSADMVNALIAGNKTMTRRIAKSNKAGELLPCRYRVGDRLWVRETWACKNEEGGRSIMFYKACEFCRRSFERRKENSRTMGHLYQWKSPLFMPRVASRITLEVVEVHRERLHDITEKDAKAEGAQRIAGTRNQTSFIKIWDSLYGNHPDKGWDANPLVDVISFRVLEIKTR